MYATIKEEYDTKYQSKQTECEELKLQKKNRRVGNVDHNKDGITKQLETTNYFLNYIQEMANSWGLYFYFTWINGGHGKHDI